MPSQFGRASRLELAGRGVEVGELKLVRLGVLNVAVEVGELSAIGVANGRVVTPGRAAVRVGPGGYSEVPVVEARLGLPLVVTAFVDEEDAVRGRIYGCDTGPGEL